ncbi:histidine phosphatase family protein [Phytopseudomonas dryadis]|uniref:Histidine phosphatase family protein n=1 Tax=Phytopseudomonas dryadis TaxID=2487520 RepID=A0A4Q9QT22_9GAMM|nr:MULTISPECIES: histidine phosphatase family protein [Pseudomonas]TBU84806.1 histidine phosphatase family protein [Pseudomonas dryadis]TBV09876.1 histidine phosphatase family protein [Pseudomonas dryadis]TBV12859.1 histidine phosphatase family protein [Pseudomonas sp. FRB 230]
MGSIYLIRHGQASFGADDYDVLSPIGIRQAEVLGAYLAETGLQLDHAISGDLLRQKHTASIALQQLPEAPALAIDAAFNEFDAEAVIRTLLPALLPHEPDALHIMRNAAHNRAEFQRLFARLLDTWIGGDYNEPALQSWQAFLEQVRGGLERLLAAAHDGQRIAVFTSGGTITALLHLLTDIPVSSAFQLNWQIVNTSLSCLKFRGEQVTLASFNSHAHLQLLKTPSLITYR